VSTGSYFTARAFLRELAVARLQSDFVAAVSHEFRTPLASLRQLTENLLDGRVTTDERRATYYRAQARATGRLHRLVEGLLDFGRMEAGVLRYRLEPLEVGDLVHSTVEEFRQDHADRGHQVELTLADGLPPVNGDREALTRALWNLLDNAAKYSPGEPTIWVEAARDRHVAVVRDGAWASRRRTEESFAVLSRIGRTHRRRQRNRHRPGHGSAHCPGSWRPRPAQAPGAAARSRSFCRQAGIRDQGSALIPDS
jgi:K+-sensing histidine kinase KdpD